jgi:hypothetical protein
MKYSYNKNWHLPSHDYIMEKEKIMIYPWSQSHFFRRE